MFFGFFFVCFIFKHSKNGQVLTYLCLQKGERLNLANIKSGGRVALLRSLVLEQIIISHLGSLNCDGILAAVKKNQNQK